MKRVCSGLNNYVKPLPEYTCLNCGGEVEIWTDENEVECTDCGLEVSRNTQSCLDWYKNYDKCREIISHNNSFVGFRHED